MHAKMCCCWAFADNRMWSWCVRLIFCTKYATLYISLRCQFDMMGIHHVRWNQDKIPVCRTRVIRGDTKDWTTTTSCDKKLNKSSYLVADMSVPNRKYTGSKNRLLPQLSRLTRSSVQVVHFVVTSVCIIEWLFHQRNYFYFSQLAKASNKES